MSAAGSPPRVRVKATTSATVELSLPERRSSHSASGFGLSAPYSVVVVGDLPDHRHERVVLQVAPDARQVVARPATPAARSSSAGPIPDSSSSCGELIAPGRQQHLALGAQRAARRGGPCAARTPTARSPSSSTPEHGRARAHLQVRPLQRRAQERVGGAEALAVSLRHLEHRRAVLLGAVVVGDPRDARGRARLQQAPVHRPRRALLGDAQRAAGAVELRGAARRCPRT